MNTYNEKNIYSVKEVAKILRTNKNYVYLLIHSGVLKAIQLGSYKILASTLDQFLKDYEGKDLSNPNEIVDIVKKQD